MKYTRKTMNFKNQIKLDFKSCAAIYLEIWVKCMPSPSFSFLIYKYCLTSSRRATEYKCNFVRNTNYSNKILLQYISHGVCINEITSIWSFFYLVTDTTLKRILLCGKAKKEIGMMVILFPEGHIFNTVFLKDSVLWTFG